LRLVPYLVSAATVAVVGIAAHALTRIVPLPHVSILFLAAVVATAVLWGFGASVFAAVLSVGAASFFFYSPIFSFRVADPQQVVDLAVFVIVAAFTSRLAASVRARALEAQRKQETVSRLLAFNERVAASGDENDLHAAILEHLAPVLGRPIHLLLPAASGLVPAASLGDGGAPPPQVCQAAQRLVMGEHAAVPGWRVEPLATAHVRAGIVAAQAAQPATDAEPARALLAQAALAIERARLRREIADARVKAQGDALREALLNSVSHDLQTPLAAILGSATALESLGEQAERGARRELVGTIREESERLASYIGNVLDLTRIRAGQVAPRLELVELSDIVNAAVRRKQKALDKCAVEVALPPDLPMLRLDLFLMEHALANVLDNAAKYARAGTRIGIAARVETGGVVLDVTDEGAGIGAADLERVFDAFYRGVGRGGAPASGTGLGLAICRAFVEANGGSVEALSAGPGCGTTLRLRLPIPEIVAETEGAVSDD
jgi:two-component system sensor histidine kinase KdpD